MRWLGRVAVAVAVLALASCKIVATPDVKALAESGAAHGAAPFDPDKMVAEIWAPKVVPYFEGHAGPFKDVQALIAKSPDEAGAKYGYRPKTDGAPWTVMVKLEGVIVAADTESRAATIGVDATGQGKPDATVQIGPAVRGTAIRDALDFVSFNDFTNQIDFARYGKAFNVHANKAALEQLPRDGLVGRKVSVIGAYALNGGDAPLVTPVEINIGPKP